MTDSANDKHSAHRLANHNSAIDPYKSEMAKHDLGGPVSRTGSIITATKLRSNNRELGFMLASLFCLLGWLAIALWLWITKLFLPENKFKRMATGDYNTMISLFGTLVGTVIALGIGAGFRSILKRKITRHQGIDILWYDAIVHFSWMSVQAKLRWTAALSIPLFLLNQTFSAASQAAFGASNEVTSFSANWSYAHLTDNLEKVQASQFSLLLYPYDSGDLLNMGHLRYADFDDTRPLIMLEGTRLYAGQDDPLVSSTVLELPRYYLNQTGMSNTTADNAASSLANAFNEEEASLFSAGNKAWQQAGVEGFLSDAACVDYDNSNVNYTFTAVEDAEVVIATFDFGCGQKLAVYSNDTAIADVHACQDGTPVIYFVFISDTSTAARQNGTGDNVDEDGDNNITFSRCDVEWVSSAIYTAAKYERGGTAIMEIKSQDTESREIPPSFEIVKFLGNDMLNNFGRQGWAGLAQSLVWVFALDEVTEGATTRINQYLERLVERLVKATLAQISGALAIEGDINKELDGQQLVLVNSQFTFFTTALQIHLSRAQLWWLVIPIALLLLQLGLSWLIIAERKTIVDFTDPVSTAFIGMLSAEPTDYDGAHRLVYNGDAEGMSGGFVIHKVHDSGDRRLGLVQDLV
ncbi:hypothetical protein OIO90_005771 [Microbotryomycetes sp. JL221]|nr:hypothetical protein OIO90_005771 [Microbotryomycetes sp. JL221]